MTPIAPNSYLNPMQILQNYFQVLSGNVGLGNFATSDSMGVPLTYLQDNADISMVRVGAFGSGLAQTWAGSHVNTTINHNLNQIPIGYLVFRKSGPCDIYSGSAAWTNKTITLQTTDDTQDTHIMIF